MNRILHRLKNTFVWCGQVSLSTYARFFRIAYILAFSLWSIQCERRPEYIKIEEIDIHNSGKAFAGSSQCVDCHRDIYDQHIQTPHFLTSTLSDTVTVKGILSSPKNRYQLNENMRFEMVQIDSVLFQYTYFKDSLIARDKIDVVIGSGTKGQSYLSWRDSLLFQLQVSYFRPTNSWTNSPGMAKRLRNNRPVFGNCLECHATFAKSSTNYMDNSYHNQQLIYGVDCERCHNPAKTHAEYHINNPDVEKAVNIVRFDTLTRQQRLDACVGCHSGLRMLTKPPFSFLTGETLTDYSTMPINSTKNAYPDVHGNQYQLLSLSDCFKQTEMDCMTCHDPHKNQRGNSSHFNGVCIKCHSSPATICSEQKGIAHAENNNCIACHMPLMPSKVLSIEIDEEGETTPLMVRTHHIDRYVDSLFEN